MMYENFKTTFNGQSKRTFVRRTTGNHENLGVIEAHYSDSIIRFTPELAFIAAPLSSDDLSDLAHAVRAHRNRVFNDS